MDHACTRQKPGPKGPRLSTLEKAVAMRCVRFRGAKPEAIALCFGVSVRFARQLAREADELMSMSEVAA